MALGRGEAVKRARLYIIALLALVMLILLAGKYLKRRDIMDRVNSVVGVASKVTQAQVASSPAPKSGAKTSQPKKATSTPTPVVLPVRNIEGLMLHLSQPLLFEVSGVRGLAVGPDFFYVATSNPQSQQATLYRVRRDTYQKDGSRNLAIGSMSTLGGIHLGQDLLWVPLSQGAPAPATLILGLDPVTLETKHTIALNGQIMAVAQGMDGLMYGIDAESAAFHVWNLEGKELQKADSRTGLRYTDLEIAKGRILAVAVTEVETGGNKEMCGVIDVLDPVDFHLLARHLSHARSVHGNQVTRSGFAFADEEFYFLPDEGKMAMLLTYRLDNSTSLEKYMSPRTSGN